MFNIMRSKNNKEGILWPARYSKFATSFEVFCKTIFKFYCPLTIQGKENLPEEPFLICSNHASHIDSAILMKASGLSFQKIGLIAAKDYFFDNSRWFYLHYIMNLVPIARGTGSRAIKDTVTVCRSFLSAGGTALVIYPEGTRSLTGKMAKFKEGAAILAHDLNLPIVPACIKGSFECLPKGSFLIKPVKLKVSFGKSFKVSDWLSYDEINDRKAIFNAYREATDQLERQVRELAGENING
jgi:1-acyl-sn-glycerol-3-phosphate acyltransferase